MSPIARVIAQILIQGTAIFTKAFVSAYQQAIHNAKRNGTASAAAAGRVMKGKMQPDEALKVLNIEKGAMTKEVIEQQFLKYFEANEPKRGGSFYLQSKVFRAKEALMRQYEPTEEPQQQESTTEQEGKEQKM